VAALAAVGSGFRTSSCVGRLTLSLLTDMAASRSPQGDMTGLVVLDGEGCAAAPSLVL
jgi:hypothetical protein